MNLIPSIPSPGDVAAIPQKAYEGLVRAGYLRDWLAYGVGAVIIFVGLAMLVKGPAEQIVKTAVEAAT